MNIEEEKFRKAVKELRDSYELHLRGWAERCLQDIEIAYEKEKEKREKLEYEATEAEEYIKGLKEKNREHYKEFIKEHGEVCEKLKEDINKEWKDKIKSKIEELQKDLENSKDAIEANIILGKKLILQSLLEEE